DRGRAGVRQDPARGRRDRAEGGAGVTRGRVLYGVGPTPGLRDHMPPLPRTADRGFQAPLDTVLPAVPCSVQATFLTGETPAGHGIVGNGWYFSELGEVLFWRQHNALVGGGKLWQAARR